jgi:hypothetical protein
MNMVCLCGALRLVDLHSFQPKALLVPLTGLLPHAALSAYSLCVTAIT